MLIYAEQRSDQFTDTDLAPTLAARDAKGGRTLVAEAIDVRNSRSNGEISGTLQAKANGGYSLNYQNPIAFNWAASVQNSLNASEVAPTIKSQHNGSPAMQNHTGVRRLTPLECERLQGFPDGWTEGLSDSARYQRLGNAVCVNVAEWLGQRIVEHEADAVRAAGRD